jgi:outer membrane receptor protein involved in Fe transport
MRFARRLEVEGAYRYSHYDTVGGTHTWKAGASWEPFTGLTLRGVRSRSVRTPNFGELFERQVVSILGSIDDPCEAGAYHASTTRAANCRALGVLTPLPDIKAGPAVTTGGNPGLRPETSNSLTLGVVLQPPFLPGFDLTVDYWNINIDDVITQFSYSRLLYLCVDLPSIDNPYCRQIVREAPLGNPVAIVSSQQNASRMYARGVDLGASFRKGVGQGMLGLSLKGTYLIGQVVETTPGIPAGDVKYANGWQNPKFRLALLASYRTERFSLSVDTRFIGAGKYDVNVSSAESYDDNTVPARLYNDVYLQFDVDGGHSWGVGVKNLFNSMPPHMPNIYYNNTVYDVIGRYFYVNVGIKL